MVSNAAIAQYGYVAKPSPTFSGNPALLKLGASIRTARLGRNLSQEALADKANIDRSYIGGVERGEHNVAIINLLKISNALETELSELFKSCEL